MRIEIQDVTPKSQEVSVEIDQFRAWHSLHGEVGIFFDGTVAMISLSDDHQESVTRILMPASTLKAMQIALMCMEATDPRWADVKSDLRADGNLF